MWWKIKTGTIMKKSILFLMLIIFGTIGIYIFIKRSNDHKECTVSIEYSKDADGNDVTTQNHVCREQYNF